MKTALFGAGEKSRKARGVVEECVSDRVVAYIENSNLRKIGGILDDLPIISIASAKRMYDNGEIDGISITTEYHKKTVEDMIRACRNIGICDNDICLIGINVLRGASCTVDSSRCVPYKNFEQIYNLNIHVTDHCNMNCELCCHGSQFIKEEVFADPDIYIRSIERLSELIPNIDNIALIGGEPLLHPELLRFAEATRKWYPYACISILTNGILLPQQTEEFFCALKRERIQLDVSLYPPMHEKVDEILKVYRENDVCGTITKVDTFFKKFTDKPYFRPEEMSADCGYCMGMRDGKLARCIDSMTIDYTNRFFNIDIPEPDCIDIFDDTISASDIMEFLEKPMEICAYCANKQTIIEQYQWRRIDPNIKKEDYLWNPGFGWVSDWKELQGKG